LAHHDLGIRFAIGKVGCFLGLNTP
jgi:hypothetical protein